MYFESSQIPRLKDDMLGSYTKCNCAKKQLDVTKTGYFSPRIRLPASRVRSAEEKKKNGKTSQC